MQSIEQVNRKSAQASLKAPLHAARSDAFKASENLLSKLPVGVLHLSGADLVITSANSCAKAFFLPLDPVGLGFRDLLALSRASGGQELVAAAETNVEKNAVRFGLQDGRKLDGFCSPLSEGGAVLTLIDVTRYAHETETALSDPLTGLMNRAGLNERLDELLTQSQSRKSQLAVIFLDLDRFKLVNDSLGHPIGDALLALVAKRIRRATRAGEVIARLGGDEFIVLQSDAPQPQTAKAVAERLVDLIGRTYIIDGHALNIGASIGIAVFPHDGADSSTLLKHADLALYQAKADGRGRYRFFQPSMNEVMQARRKLEIELRKALALKEFELVYQPQIDVENDRLTGFEALIRWRHPIHGLISPADFIPLAEEIGLITKIGDWALNTACQEAASWTRPVSIAVNLSPLQFQNPALVQTVAAALEASGLDPARLELEITEGLLLKDTDETLKMLQALKALGVKITMDDFGTGYSSLSYLQKFPFDKIKIDGSLIRSENDSTRALISAVTAIGQSLHMNTIAEGVETAEQLAHVKAAGCENVQGFLTGKPESAASATARVNAISNLENRRAI